MLDPLSLEAQGIHCKAFLVDLRAALRLIAASASPDDAVGKCSCLPATRQAGTRGIPGVPERQEQPKIILQALQSPRADCDLSVAAAQHALTLAPKHMGFRDGMR